MRPGPVRPTGVPPTGGEVRDRLDVVSLGAGSGLIAVGGLLLLDQAGSLELTIGLAGALMAGLIGMILLLSGLNDDER